MYNNTTHVTNVTVSRAFCERRREQFRSVDDDGVIAALVLFVIFAVVGLIINSFVAFLLFITKQLENRSFRLEFCLSLKTLSN